MRLSQFITSAAFLLFSISSLAQSSEQWISEDGSRAANCHHPYIQGEYADSPVPEGYSCFYISHYGRHGSRYHSSDRSIMNMAACFDSLHFKGLLTEKGESVRNDLHTMCTLQSGKAGLLTDLGEKEHREIAARMAARFPEVFAQQDRKQVYAISTYVPRVVQSMANFTASLQTSTKGLNMHLEFGEDTQEILNKRYRASKEHDRIMRHAGDSVKASLIYSLDSFVCSAFTDTASVAAYYKKDIHELLYSLFTLLDMSYCFDTESIAPFDKYFETEELIALGKAGASYTFSHYADCLENEGERMKAIGSNSLRDIVEKCDQALEDGSNVCANLRFGHDTTVAPMLALMGVDGFQLRSVAESAEWLNSKFLCMATNFQMIFYRNASGNVLVKMLLNERETLIPSLQPEQGVYYNWVELREYLVEKL